MSGKLTAFILLTLLILSPAATDARIWVVNPEGTGDAPTIAAAVDSAFYMDDIIELADGIYSGVGNRDITNNSKNVMIRSQSGNPEACIIDCQGSAEEPHSGFHFYGDG